MGLLESSSQSFSWRVWVVAIVPLGLLNPPASVAWGQSSNASAHATFDSVIQVKGTLKSAQKNFITITRSDGEDVTVMLHEDPTRLKVTAEAKPAQLAGDSSPADKAP